MKIDGIIFDLDGTLWDSTEGICGTWCQVLKKHPDIKKEITMQDLHACMGLPIEKIGEKLFPELSVEMQLQLMKECSEAENIYLGIHGGTLYPQLEATLQELQKSYQLYIVSNCQDGYIQSFYQAHKLEPYFLDFECLGRTGLSKGENNKQVMGRNHLKSAIYVGDTSADAESARVAGIPFVYASYGFGQVDVYDYKIECFSELLKLLDDGETK